MISLELTKVEIGILVVAGLLLICFVVSGWILAAPFPFLAGIFIICWSRHRQNKAHFSHTLPAMARIVNYHVETHTTNRRYGPNETYQVWAPVVEFETERGTVKAEYPIYKREHWFRFEEEYEIRYCPEQPEYFYFTSRREERVNSEEGGFIVLGIMTAAYAVALLICLMNT